MEKQRYIAFIDVLGFEKIAQELVSQRYHYDTAKTREQFLLKPMEELVEQLRIRFPNMEIIPGHDDYTLISGDIGDIFIGIDSFTTIRLPPKKFGFIPFQIALGKVMEENFSSTAIARDGTINFLRNDILSGARNYFKHSFSELKSFVVVTTPLYEGLDGLEKQNVEVVEYNGNVLNILKLDYINSRVKALLFCAKLDLPRRYSRIDEIYVEPMNYTEIKKTLKKNKVIFLTGDAESGKTYTAIRILWEYYQDGFDIKYISGREKTERRKSAHALLEMSNGKNSQQIIYFEDPFGKESYEPNEILEREFQNTLSEFANEQNLYAIITSRNEVYKEFLLHSALADKNLEKYRFKFNFHSAYDNEKRVKMLTLWANAKNCKWLFKQNLKSDVLKFVENSNMLPTPLTIRSFATESQTSTDLSNLEGIANDESKGTAIAFAKEIKAMSKDKIAFLLFLMVSEFHSDFIKTKYNELLNHFRDDKWWEFDRLLDWFGRDERIDILKIGDKSILKFSHPSFTEALEYVLVEGNYPSTIYKSIFHRILTVLMNIDEIKYTIVTTIIKYSYAMPPETREILYKLLGKENARVEIISYMIEKPENLILTNTIQEILLPEGIFLVLMITEQATSEKLNALLENDFDWKKVLDLLTKVEKFTLKRYAVNILGSLLEYDYSIINPPFYNRLVNRAIESEIMQMVRNELIHRDTIVSNIHNHPILSKVIGIRNNLITNDNVNKRIEVLLEKKLIKYWHHKPMYLRPSKKLSLQIQRTNETYSLDRMEKILRVVSEELRLDNADFDSLKNIMKKVHPSLEGRRIRAVAAGILYYYVIINYIPVTNEEISRRVGVNPVTTGKLYREVRRIMEKE